MVLSKEKILELLKVPKNSALIRRAKYHESRLKFHADDAIEHSDLAAGYLEQFIKNLIEPFLTEEKVTRFKQAMPVPLPTTGIIDEIKDQYAKVFEAKDKFFNIERVDETEKKQVEALLMSLKEESFWQDTAFDTLFSAVNTLIVIDRPEDGGDPYFYLMDFSSVHDIGLDKFGKNIEYIIQRESSTEFLIIDSEKFARYEKTDDAANPFVEIQSVPHFFGSVPANFLWQDSLKDPLVKRSACTSILGLLDDYVVQSVNKKNLDFLNAYPIMWKYEDDDDDDFLKETITNELSERVQGETILPLNSDVNAVYADLRKKRKSKMGGPGVIVSVPAPMDNTEADLRDPIGFISPPIEALRYNSTELDSLGNKIYVKATGRPEHKDVADRPVNGQIQSQYEGERNVLLWVSYQLSTTRSWLVSALGKMLLGKDIACTADFGSEFFIEDERAVIENLREYRLAGASQAQIAFRTDSLRQVSTKGKRSQFQRLEIMSHLEPLSNQTLEIVSGMAEKGLVDFKDFDLKNHFPERIAKFERENGSILIYRQSDKITFKELIEDIKQKLYTYGSDTKFDNGFDSKEPIGVPEGVQPKKRLPDKNVVPG